MNIPEKKMRTIAYASAFIWFIVGCSRVLADSPELTAKLQQVYREEKTITWDTLSKPENVELLQTLQAKAKIRGETVIRTIMIRLDDQTTINDALEQYRIEDARDRASASEQFFRAANPKTIPLLAVDLDRQEGVSPYSYNGGDFGMYPLSVQATINVTEIIVRSDAFAPEVKHWAENLSTRREEARKSIRDWWKLNKVAIEAGNYSAVVVPPSR